MKVEYLNPVLNGIYNVLNQTGQLEFEKKKLDKCETLQPEKDFSVIMNFEGDLEGFVSISFDEALAIDLVQKMTGGMGNENELDDMGKSALGEIGGMMKGNIITELSGVELSPTISEPDFSEKEKVPALKHRRILKVTMATDPGDIEIHLCLNKK